MVVKTTWRCSEQIVTCLKALSRRALEVQCILLSIHVNVRGKCTSACVSDLGETACYFLSHLSNFVAWCRCTCTAKVDTLPPPTPTPPSGVLCLHFAQWKDGTIIWRLLWVLDFFQRKQFRYLGLGLDVCHENEFRASALSVRGDYPRYTVAPYTHQKHHIKS